MATLYDGVIGMTVEEAKHFLKPHGINRVRIRQKNGVPLIGTCDYCPDRINVAVVDDRIVSWSGID